MSTDINDYYSLWIDGFKNNRIKIKVDPDPFINLYWMMNLN